MPCCLSVCVFNVYKVRDAYHTFGHKIIEGGVAEQDDWPSDVPFSHDEAESDFVGIHNFRPDSIDTETFYVSEPVDPVSESTRESLFAQATASAKAYNSRLKSLRSKPFYDVHTGLMQHPRNTQVGHVNIEMKCDGNSAGFLSVEDHVHVKGDATSVNGIARLHDREADSKRWKTLVPSLATKRAADALPLALLPGQKRMTVSLYFRFIYL